MRSTGFLQGSFDGGGKLPFRHRFPIHQEHAVAVADGHGDLPFAGAGQRDLVERIDDPLQQRAVVVADLVGHISVGRRLMQFKERAQGRKVLRARARRKARRPNIAGGETATFRFQQSNDGRQAVGVDQRFASFDYPLDARRMRASVRHELGCKYTFSGRFSTTALYLLTRISSFSI